MKTEYEVKFLRIDVDDIRQRLLGAGGSCSVPMRLMRRVTIDSPYMHDSNGFLRVRDEGDKVTMTYKQFDALSVEGAKEHEVIVSDFDETVKLLQAVGLPYRSYQESRRETWQLGDAEIVIDEWPWIDPYIEIEAENEDILRGAAQALGLDWADAAFGDVMVAYRDKYIHLTEKDTVANISEVKFGDSVPELFKPR